MKVFKFGGASVKDAQGIRNLAGIVSGEKDDLVVVISAFGKTTNALEIVLRTWMNNEDSYKDHLENIYDYHDSIVEELFPSDNLVNIKINNSFSDLKNHLTTAAKSDYDFEYDQIVSYGEIWSTLIVSEYLNITGNNNIWTDIRKVLITDERYRDANVIWDITSDNVKKVFNPESSQLFVTQGFIGGTLSGHYTTLSREGSDYTAALLANILDAESVIFWKDVPGLLNADPRWLPDARRLEQMSYREAVEMTFSGAKVIHPKTIKPLQNKNIPLYVKSFIAPLEEGTVVVAEPEVKRIIPVFIKKENQMLISFLPKDFSFVMGDNLAGLFSLFFRYGIKVNLVEASAVSIDVCIDDERLKIDALMNNLHQEYTAIYNDNVEILTIRHYNAEAVEQITYGREILLEQRTRSTVRYVVRKL